MHASRDCWPANWIFFWTIQLEKFLPLRVRWRRCLPPRSATPDSVLLFLEILAFRFRQPAFAPMPASRSWLAPVYRCSQRLPQINLCKLTVHSDWPDLRPTLWGCMMHYLLDCSRYLLEAFPFRVLIHTSAECRFSLSSFLHTLPN